MTRVSGPDQLTVNATATTPTLLSPSFKIIAFFTVVLCKNLRDWLKPVLSILADTLCGGFPLSNHLEDRHQQVKLCIAGENGGGSEEGGGVLKGKTLKTISNNAFGNTNKKNQCLSLLGEKS